MIDGGDVADRFLGFDRSGWLTGLSWDSRVLLMYVDVETWPSRVLVIQIKSLPTWKGDLAAECWGVVQQHVDHHGACHEFCARKGGQAERPPQRHVVRKDFLSIACFYWPCMFSLARIVWLEAPLFLATLQLRAWWLPFSFWMILVEVCFGDLMYPPGQHEPCVLSSSRRCFCSCVMRFRTQVTVKTPRFVATLCRCIYRLLLTRS